MCDLVDTFLISDYIFIMNNTEIQERLRFFFDFFEERIKFIEENCLNRIEGLILSCCYLDSLAGYKYGGRSSKKKFKKFILSYSGFQSIWNRISLPLLKRCLERKNHEFYKPFIKFLEDKLGVKKNKYTDLSYNVDVDLQTLQEKAKGLLEDRYLLQLKGELEEFEYTSILWRDYRNFAVHKTSSKKDEAHPLVEKTEPFYVNYGIMEGNKITREETLFGIPPIFILNTLKACLKNFTDECLKTNIDLFDLEEAIEHPYFKSKKRAIDEENDIDYPRLITKPFRFIYSDAEYFLKKAQICQETFAKTNNAKYKELEAIFSRSCLLFCVVFLEGLTNNILGDFQVVSEDQLPETLRRKCGLNQKELNKISLEDKIYLLPYLCSQDSKFGEEYFQRESKEFQELRELIRIRNSYVHPHPIKRKLQIEMTTDRKFLAKDEFPQNFWPLTKIPKDIFIFQYNHAERAKLITDNIFKKLDNFLQGRLTKDNWLINEKIEFDPSKKTKE